MLVPAAHTDTVALIYAAREAKADIGLRPHLGASQIGAPCTRALWYGFRWSKRQQFSGRMLRLFETGQLAEARFIDELRSIGCEVSEGPAPGEQWRVSSLGGHFGGSMDAACLGLPEAPKTWHCCEFKTHNAKSFKELSEKGVEKAKPQHYAQMQIYMALTGMERALYLASNKDTDELYSERVHADADAAKKLIDRAELIIYSEEPPPKISNDPAFFQCKFCDYSGICHGTDAPLPTCRSCAHVTPERNGCWSCALHVASDIPTDAQKEGCEGHRYNPHMLTNFAEMLSGSLEGNTVAYKNTLTGNHFNNDEGGASDYSSWEIFHAYDKKALGDPMVEEVRDEFGAKIVESI